MTLSLEQTILLTLAALGLGLLIIAAAHKIFWKVSRRRKIRRLIESGDPRYQWLKE